MSLVLTVLNPGRWIYTLLFFSYFRFFPLSLTSNPLWYNYREKQPKSSSTYQTCVLSWKPWMCSTRLFHLIYKFQSVWQIVICSARNFQYLDVFFFNFQSFWQNFNILTINHSASWQNCDVFYKDFFWH